MPIQKVNTISYITPDGREFETKTEAMIHAQTAIYSQLREVLYTSSASKVLTDQIVLNNLYHNRKEFIKILRDIDQVII